MNAQVIPIHEPDASDSPFYAAVAAEIAQLAQDVHMAAMKLDVLRVSLQAQHRQTRRPFEESAAP